MSQMTPEIQRMTKRGRAVLVGSTNCIPLMNPTGKLIAGDCTNGNPKYNRPKRPKSKHSTRKKFRIRRCQWMIAMKRVVITNRRNLWKVKK